MPNLIVSTANGTRRRTVSIVSQVQPRFLNRALDHRLVPRDLKGSYVPKTLNNYSRLCEGLVDGKHAPMSKHAMTSGKMEVAAIPRMVRTQYRDGMMLSVGVSHEVYQTNGITRESTAKKTIRAWKDPMRSRRRQSQNETPIAITHEAQDMAARAKRPCQARANALPASQQDAPRAPVNQPVASQ